MAGIRFCMLKSLAGSVRATEHFNVRPIFAILGHNYHTDTCTKNFNFNPRASPQICKSSAFSSALLNPRTGVNFPLVRMTPMLGYHPYSSFASGGGKGGDEGVGVPEASGSGEVDVSGSGGIDVNEWVDKLKDGWKSAVDGVTVAVEKVKETSGELTPQVQQVLDSHPYLNNVVVPVGGTITAAMLAWLVMPRILKRLHGYTRGSAVLLSRSVLAGEVPYEKSVWAALEDPVRYLVTFMAFSQVCCLVAPKALACQFVAQAWKGAVVLSSVWFLHRWKTNLFARALAAPNVNMIDRDKLLTLDKVSSVGLFAVGVMALAEACGVAVQSILTVGGIGGVATAFAARDILGNVLSGMSMQFSKPFSLGDTIKAGSIEGQVVDMGLTTTSLLNAEKFPVIVPNSMFSSQVIVNKSRAEWRAFMSTIPLQLDSVENVPQISDKIKEMLRSYPKAFLGREAPYCYLSRIETSYAEITLGCNLKHMSKEERYSTEQDILLQSIQIIKQHGASLGSSQQDFITK